MQRVRESIQANSVKHWLLCFTCIFMCSISGARTLQDIAGQLTNEDSVTTLYLAKEFITMDPDQPRAEAVAVREGQFVAVGTLSEVKKRVGENALIDRRFANKTVTAGFIEPHVHPVLAAITMKTKVLSIEDWDTIDGFSPAIRDEKTYQAALKQAIQAHEDKSAPFVSWGYHHYFHGKLSRTLLNELAPDFPVVIWHRSAHEFYLNDAALALAKIDEALIASLPAGVQKQIDFGKGHFYESGAFGLLGNFASIIATPERFKQGLEYTEKYYHEAGVTTACEPGGFYSKVAQDAVNAVYSDDATPFNHCFIADGKSIYTIGEGNPERVIAETENTLSWGDGRTWFLPDQVKLFTDGAIYSQLMQMQDGYIDGHNGEWIVEPEPFDKMFQLYWDAGYQIHTHNNGDGGLEVLLKSLEKAMERNPREDHRATLVHFGFAKPEQVKRWIELGGIISANPYYVTALAGHYVKFGVGERSENMVPLGDVLKNKGSMSFHSDMPMAPAKPLQLAWSAVNRITAEGKVMGKQHRVSVEQALKAITIDAAYALRMEKVIGSIEVGKSANLTVLEDSPFDVAPTALKDIEVWGTMLEGRLQPIGKNLARTAEKSTNPRATPELQEAITAQLRKFQAKGSCMQLPPNLPNFSPFFSQTNPTKPEGERFLLNAAR